MRAINRDLSHEEVRVLIELSSTMAGTFMKTVWFVEIDYVILAVFAHEEDAKLFFDAMDDEEVSGSMYSRTVHYGQPANQGYNE